MNQRKICLCMQSHGLHFMYVRFTTYIVPKSLLDRFFLTSGMHPISFKSLPLILMNAIYRRTEQSLVHFVPHRLLGGPFRMQLGGDRRRARPFRQERENNIFIHSCSCFRDSTETTNEVPPGDFLIACGSPRLESGTKANSNTLRTVRINP